MAPASIPTTEPTRAIAGDTWRWNRSVADYSPASGWALTYAFRGAGKLDVAGVANAANNGWEMTVAASATAALKAGVYEWVAYVTKSGERYTVDAGRVTVQPNFALANAGDRQSHAERTLAVIEAAIEGRLTADMEEYQIQGRAVKRIPMALLQTLRNRYAFEVTRQRAGGRTPQTEVTFARP